MPDERVVTGSPIRRRVRFRGQGVGHMLPEWDRGAKPRHRPSDAIDSEQARTNRLNYIFGFTVQAVGPVSNAGRTGGRGGALDWLPQLDDNECEHGRCLGDRSEPCGCYPSEA